MQNSFLPFIIFTSLDDGWGIGSSFAASSAGFGSSVGSGSVGFSGGGGMCAPMLQIKAMKNTLY